MAFTTGNFVTPQIENTTQQEILREDASVYGYYIKAIDGYALHDKELDQPEFDPEIMAETGRTVLGFTEWYCSVYHTYNFEVNPREFYAVPLDELPDLSEIFGGGNNHETI